MNSNKIKRNPKCDFKTIEPNQEPKPIIISKNVFPPDYINVDDNSDEEITCLGTYNTFSIELPENTQPSNLKEERITSKPDQDINHCNFGSDVKETSKSQRIIPEREVSQDRVKKNFMTNLNVNSTLPAAEGKSISKSQYNIHKSTSSSVILSDINRANQTSHDDSGSIPSEEGQEKQTNASCPKERSTNFNQIVSNVCSPQENNSSWSHEVRNTSVLLQNTSSSSGVTFSSPMSSNGASGKSNDHHKDNDSTTTVQNHGLSPGTQQTFGSKIKQQVRYVTLPAKFLTEIVTKQITSSISTGSNVVKLVHGNFNKQPVNMNVLKGELCKVGDKTQTSATPKVQISDVSGLSKSTTVNSAPTTKNPSVTSQKIVFIKNNANVISTSNSLTNINTVPQAPPSMLLFNNQVIKLKGTKQQESLLRNASVRSSDSQRKNESPVPINSGGKCGVDQCCQTDNSTKTVVDQSCQTNIYSWVYKNSKLYTFIDDRGKQVEIVPVETVKVAKRPIEVDVASPVSSLDNESDVCLEDDISVTDEPTVLNNFEYHHLSDNGSVQTGRAESDHHISEIEPNTPQNIPHNYQHQNTFQEVLYTDLGLYNSASQAMNNIQTDSFGNQNVFQNSTYQQENTNTNTVYNHELQMYVPSSQKPVPEPVFEQPADVNPDVQYSTPNTNPVVDIFNKLIGDIRTCLSIDSLGNIPLHQATLDNDLVKLKSQCIVLKTIGSSLNHLNLAHETALILAVKVAVDTNDYEAVSILVSEGADQRIADMEGNTPLHYAVKHGCDQLVRVLLTADDADKVTEKFNHDGLTPLHIAALEGYDDVIKLLVGTNIDINVKDRKNGRTPYFLAVKEKKWTSAKLLKMLRADVNEPNFADQMPLVIASPEKSLPRPYGVEENVDDNFNVRPTHTEIEMPLAKENMSDISRFPKLFGTNERMRDIWESSFVYVGRNKTGLKHPPQVLSRNELESNSERVVKSSEAFDAKELYDKYVKIAAKNKSDPQLEEPVAKPKTVFVKKPKLKPTAQSKSIDNNFQSKNVAVSSNNEKILEDDRCKNDSQSQSHLPPEAEASIRESQHQHTTNCKAIHGDIKCHKVHKININNDSVLYNKAVLTSNIIQEHHLNSNVVRQNCGNKTKPTESKVASKVNKFSKLTCKAVQDERSRSMQLNAIENSEIVQGFALEKNDQVHDITLNYTKQGSILKNLSEIPTLEHPVIKNSPRDYKINCQSPSEISTDITVMSCLELHTDNPINENESFVEENQFLNPNGHFSKNDQNISLNHSSELTLGEKSNALLRTPHLSVESQEMSQSSCKVINRNSGKKDSIKANHSVNPIGYSSLDYIHTPSRTVPKTILWDKSSELLHLPKEIHEKCQSSDVHHVFNSEKKSSDEPKQPVNFICKSSSDDRNKNSTNSSNQGPKITSRKRSSKMLKEKQINSLTSSKDIKSNGGKNNSVGVKKMIRNSSTSEGPKNCPSIHLHTENPKEGSSEMLNKSHCTKAIEESPPPQDLNSKKQFVKKVTDNKIQGNKTNVEADEDSSCFEETSLNIDFGCVKDVIIGNDDSKSNRDITNINTCNLLSKAETEHVQLSFDALLDDVVNKRKEENSSSQKSTPKQRRHRKRKLDESDVLMKNSQKAVLKKKQNAGLTDVAPTATDRVNSLISYPQKIVSGSNKKNNVSSSKMFLQSNAESKELKAGYLQNTNLTKVSGSGGVQNLNPEARGKLRTSPLDDSESNKTPILNSSAVLVTNMRNKLVSLVSCKALLPNKVSNNVALRESTPPSVSMDTKSQSEKLPEKTERRSSKSNSSEQIQSSITPAVPKLSNAQSQANRTTSRKRSLDSVESRSQGSQKKRISKNNSEVTTREDVQKVEVSNTLSRRSTRVSKKKVEFDL